jgi:hypothetical protein
MEVPVSAAGPFGLRKPNDGLRGRPLEFGRIPRATGLFRRNRPGTAEELSPSNAYAVNSGGEQLYVSAASSLVQRQADFGHERAEGFVQEVFRPGSAARTRPTAVSTAASALHSRPRTRLRPTMPLPTVERRASAYDTAPSHRRRPRPDARSRDGGRDRRRSNRWQGRQAALTLLCSRDAPSAAFGWVGSNSAGTPPVAEWMLRVFHQSTQPGSPPLARAAPGKWRGPGRVLSLRRGRAPFREGGAFEGRWLPVRWTG